MIASNSNLLQTYNFTSAGTYYITIHHNITSETNLISMSLVVSKIPCDPGYIFNSTVSSCVRNCSNDTKSLNIYAPWSFHECYCFSNFKWDFILSKCSLIGLCDFETNNNGALICDKPFVYLNSSKNLVNDTYPINLAANDYL